MHVNKIYDSIKENTASRGRFLDYAVKMLIKETIKGLIKGFSYMDENNGKKEKDGSRVFNRLFR